MKTLPPTTDTPVLRTDYSDPEAWDAVRAKLGEPSEEDEFLAYVEILDDPAYQDLAKEQILAMLPEDYPHAIIIVADKTAISSAETPFLTIDLIEEPGRELRVIATELWSIENNLSIANMDFVEFFDAADEDGVFRGF